MSFVYARSTAAARLVLWRKIAILGQTDRPWVMMGDYNAYMNIEEKIGYPGFHVELCPDLIDGIIEAGLEDIKS